MRLYLFKKFFFIISIFATSSVGFCVNQNSIHYLIEKNIARSDSVIRGKIVATSLLEENGYLFQRIQIQPKVEYSRFKISRPNKNLLNIYKNLGPSQSVFSRVIENNFKNGSEYYFMLNYENDRLILLNFKLSAIGLNIVRNRIKFIANYNRKTYTISEFNFNKLLSSNINLQNMRNYKNISRQNRIAQRFPASIEEEITQNENKIPSSVLFIFMLSLVIIYFKVIRY